MKPLRKYDWLIVALGPVWYWGWEPGLTAVICVALWAVITDPFPAEEKAHTADDVD